LKSERILICMPCQVGDKCMAVWSKNNQLYEAVIDGISEGKAAVTFVGYNVTEINKLHLLRICENTQPKRYLWDSKPKGKSLWQVEKERRRKKAQKKAQRQKQLEEEKELEKMKWKDFSSKAVSKSYKGVKKESIFASPDTESGRVGVGTCGISGKPMTNFISHEKLVTGKSSQLILFINLNVIIIISVIQIFENMMRFKKKEVKYTVLSLFLVLLFLSYLSRNVVSSLCTLRRTITEYAMLKMHRMINGKVKTVYFYYLILKKRLDSFDIIKLLILAFNINHIYLFKKKELRLDQHTDLAVDNIEECKAQKHKMLHDRTYCKMTIKMGHYILKDLGAISECQYLCILVIVYQFLLNRFGFQNETSDAHYVQI
ncbi:Survival of motor neuron-related-splicing factor 30, partial [Trichinella sp. T9]